MEESESITRDNFIGATNGSRSVFCFRAVPTNSGGIWLGDNPLDFPLPNLLYQIALIFLLYRLIHLLFRSLSLPIHVTQIVTGILLSPNLLGRNQQIKDTLISPQTYSQFKTTTVLGSILFNFMAGVKVDLGMIPKVGRMALFVALFTTFLPAVALYAAGRGLRSTNHIPAAVDKTYMLLIVSDKWCVSSYVVLSVALSELNLLSSKLGRLAMSSALISNFVHVVFDICVMTYLLSVEMHSPVKGVEALAGFLCFVGIIMLVFRPMAMWMIKRTPERDTMDEAHLVALIIMALACGVMSKLIGFDITTGAFFFGLVLPGGVPLGATLQQNAESLVVALLMPLTFATAGMRMRMQHLRDVEDWWWFEMLLMLSIVTKFLGATLPCIFWKMPARDTITVGLMMICKGVYEVSAAVVWDDDQLVDKKQYTVLMLTILVFSGGIAPVIKLLYRPEDRFVAYKRRTLEQSKPGDELRILACIHAQDNVNPLLVLLKACGPSVESPLTVCVVHLVQLVGRSDAILVAHDKGRKNLTNSSSSSSSSSSTSYSIPADADSDTVSESDHIVNAFRMFQEHYSQEAMGIHPYVCISPYNTMQLDVCSLALDKKVTLIILPFHKFIIADGSISSANPGVQAVNVSVLQYAPCSVGILVDQGLAVSVQAQVGSVAVYFFGGPDDREALAFATRMADLAAIQLTVVRFLPPEKWRNQTGVEERFDEEMLKQFQQEKVDGRRVVYREEEVKDGEDTVAVIREISSSFSLLLVGRRQGKDSPMTSGLSMWSEYPELGLIGDLLASTDFGGRVSTLVVQQQTRVKATSTVQIPDSPKRAPMHKLVQNILQKPITKISKQHGAAEPNI